MKQLLLLMLLPTLAISACGAASPNSEKLSGPEQQAVLTQDGKPAPETDYILEELPIVEPDATDSYNQAPPSAPAQTEINAQIEVVPPPVATTLPTSSETKLMLIPSGQFNRFGNPLYTLAVYVNGQAIASVPTVTGRHYTQTRDRHQSGTKAPLPNGMYRVATASRASSEFEVGGRFLDVTPLFRTGRTALGIHHDPSFNVDKELDGTSGCIGTTTRQDRDLIYSLIQQHRITKLEVNI